MGKWVKAEDRHPSTSGRYKVQRHVGNGQLAEDEYTWNGSCWVTRRGSQSYAVVYWMEEADDTRTKLICNLRMDDFFKCPDRDGTWRRMNDTMVIDGKKHYRCQNLDDTTKLRWLPGNARVELAEKGA